MVQPRAEFLTSPEARLLSRCNTLACVCRRHLKEVILRSTDLAAAVIEGMRILGQDTHLADSTHLGTLANWGSSRLLADPIKRFQRFPTIARRDRFRYMRRPYFQGRIGSRTDHLSLKISIDGCVDPASC